MDGCLFDLLCLSRSPCLSNLGCWSWFVSLRSLGHLNRRSSYAQTRRKQEIERIKSNALRWHAHGMPPTDDCREFLALHRHRYETYDGRTTQKYCRQACNNVTSSTRYGSLTSTSRFGYAHLPQLPGLEVVRRCLVMSQVTDVR